MVQAIHTEIDGERRRQQEGGAEIVGDGDDQWQAEQHVGDAQTELRQQQKRQQATP